jgi:hypothetical protein
MRMGFWGKGAKGFFVSGPYPLPKPLPQSFKLSRLSRGRGPRLNLPFYRMKGSNQNLGTRIGSSSTINACYSEVDSKRYYWVCHSERSEAE